MSNNHDLLNDNDMYSFSGYEANDMCSNKDAVACRDGCLAFQGYNRLSESKGRDLVLKD